VIVTAKFMAGAWIVVLAIPAIFALLLSIRKYYDRLDESLAPGGPFDLEEIDPPTVLVAVETRNRMTDAAISFAMTLSPDVIAVHLLKLSGPEAEEDGREVKRLWERDMIAPLNAKGVTPPRLIMLPAPHRQIHGPLLEFIETLDADTPGRSVAVLIPQMMLTHWWERLLHTRRADRLRAALLAHGGPRLKVVISPWRRL
jgi:hypothetical protein